MNPESTLRLIEEEDPRAKTGAPSEVLFTALVLCKKDKQYPTKQNVKKKIEEQTEGRLKGTISTALSIADKADHIPEKEPEKTYGKEELLKEIRTTTF